MCKRRNSDDNTFGSFKPFFFLKKPLTFFLKKVVWSLLQEAGADSVLYLPVGCPKMK